MKQPNPPPLLTLPLGIPSRLPPYCPSFSASDTHPSTPTTNCLSVGRNGIRNDERNVLFVLGHFSITIFQYLPLRSFSFRSVVDQLEFNLFNPGGEGGGGGGGTRLGYPDVTGDLVEPQRVSLVLAPQVIPRFGFRSFQLSCFSFN